MRPNSTVCPWLRGLLSAVTFRRLRQETTILSIYLTLCLILSITFFIYYCYLNIEGREHFDLLPPSKWTPITLEDLKVAFMDYNSLAAMFPSSSTVQLSIKATTLLNELKDLDINFILSYESRSSSARKNADLLSTTEVDSTVLKGFSGKLSEPTKFNDSQTVQLQQHPLCKALFIMDKYSHLESPVDSFVFQLLCYLGFNDDWLYIFPQMQLRLRSKNKEVISKPDFTLMDIISFFRA